MHLNLQTHSLPQDACLIAPPTSRSPKLYPWECSAPPFCFFLTQLLTNCLSSHSPYWPPHEAGCLPPGLPSPSDPCCHRANLQIAAGEGWPDLQYLPQFQGRWGGRVQVSPLATVLARYEACAVCFAGTISFRP